MWHRFNHIHTHSELIAQLLLDSRNDYCQTTTLEYFVIRFDQNNRTLLWSLKELKMLCDLSGLEKDKTYTYIHCDIIEQIDGIWCYMSESEANSPEYYSCPLSYLAKADFEVNEEWRARVRDYNKKHYR